MSFIVLIVNGVDCTIPTTTPWSYDGVGFIDGTEEGPRSLDPPSQGPKRESRKETSRGLGEVGGGGRERRESTLGAEGLVSINLVSE